MNSIQHRNGVLMVMVCVAASIVFMGAGHVTQAGDQSQVESTPVPSQSGKETATTQLQKKAESIVDLVINDAGSFVQVDIVADGNVGEFKNFNLKQPSRLVVDFPGLKSFLPYKTKETASPLVKRIRCAEHQDYTRTVLESASSDLAPFAIIPTQSGITVLLGSGFEQKKEELIASANSVENREKENSQPNLASATPEETTQVNAPQIDVQSAPVLAKTNEGVENSAIAPPSERSSLDHDPETVPQDTSSTLSPASGPASLTDNNPTPLTQPTKIADPPQIQKEDIALRQKPPNTPVAEISALQSDPAPSVPQASSEALSSPEVTQASQAKSETSPDVPEIAREESPPAPKKEASEARSAQSPIVGGEVPGEGEGLPRYNGAHLSLDFKDADIRNILRLIADVSNLNIVAGEDVQGTVTIKLNDVPWDQALDVILLSSNLGKTVEGNILRIVPLDRLNKERQAALADREAVDKLEPLRKGLIPVSYADAKSLKDVVFNAKALSSRGSVEIDKRTNTLIIIDLEKNIQEIRNIVDQLDSPTPQVLIEAKVIQINPTYTRDLGVTWEAGYTTPVKDGLLGIGGQGGVDIDLGKGTVTTKGPQIDLAPAVGPGTGGALSFGFLNPAFGISAKIAALEKEEKLEILSSPRIMTLDNQEASIEQGVDLPYLQLNEQGVTSTEFKKATLSLKVLPHITADGSVMMEVEVKKDQKSAQTGAGGEPGIDTRRAESKILVRNGYTVVIGGIYEENIQDINNSVPFLGRLPVLGFMFKEKLKKREKTELIVFITPTIVTIEKSRQMETAVASPN